MPISSQQKIKLKRRTWGFKQSNGLSSVFEPTIAPGTTTQYWRGDKTWHTLDKFDESVAGETLGGQRAVRIGSDDKAYYANPDNTSILTIGLTTGAVASGANAVIQIDGEMVEPSWTWASTGPVYLAANGMLTQIVPTSGALFLIGIPMGPTSLRIAPQMIALL